MDAPTLLRRPAARREAPALDADQRRAVEHAGGPLLVLAGPGTGKTTTLVEAVVHRVEQGGLAPEQVLLLTFSRKAAQELRERVTARLGRTTRGALAMTFHGYAYALLRRELSGPGAAPLRLLSGPEQDLEVRRMLEGEREDGGLRWPDELRAALGLRGFRQELRDLLLRAQERGIGPERLAELGRRRGRPDWVAAAGFLRDYEGRFDLDPFAEVLDYAGLVRTAAALLEGDDDLRHREREARAVVLVDEYQDTDPAQVRLLQALAGDGRDLVAVGDPDQSIYAFRGADVRGVLEFPDVFRTAAGVPAPQVELTTCRRSGAVLLQASRAVASRLPAGRLGPGFRALRPDADVVPGEGQVEVRLATTPTAEAALVADVLRRAHLRDGVPWSDMAVLLRSTPRSLAGLRRGLLAAGVPVAVPGDELPLAEEPVVRALLELLAAALRPDRLDEDAALALLGGPLVHADALAVRRLRRALREADTRAERDTPAPALLVEAVRDPRVALLLPERAGRPLLRLQRLVAAVREVAGVPLVEPLPDPLPPAPVEDVLWAGWERSGLATRYEEASRQGGARGAVADRALDAVIALFDAAARYVDRLPGESTLGFLDDVAAQEVPGDSLAQRTPEGDAVRVLTAHASKGLEWRLVVVAGVQEGVWPDLRLRGSLLGAGELPDAAGGLPAEVDRRGELLAEERRLFYVAVTRARERLVVTAVASGEGGEDRPSRFLSELGVELPLVAAPAGRPFTTSGLVAELRHVAATSDDPGLVEAACRRLARLVDGNDDTPRSAAADPGTWWGLAPLSDDAPLVTGDETVRVSPSKVESFDLCALRWFLQSGVGISGSSGPPQVLGSLVHALCELASGPQALSRADLEAQLDAVLPRLDLGAPWAARRRRREALEWLDKFLAWQADSARVLVGTELDVVVPLGPGAELRRPGRPAGARPARPRRRRRPQDLQRGAGEGRGRPAAAAGRLPGGGRAGGLPGARAPGVGRRRAAAAADAPQRGRAVPGRARGRRRAELGPRAGRAGRGGHGRQHLPGLGQRALRPLPGPGLLPAVARGRGRPAMTTTTGVRRFDLDDLTRVLGRPVSDEQAQVVQAPLGAGVVVAGAGSGKTATMVARVVWLVARGEVAPDGVLGLTFTTKAAEELAGRVRGALRLLRREGLLPDAEAELEPVVSTYHAYAGQLVRDHALRLAREPTSRLITPATSWQLAARAVATYDGALDAKDMAESTVVQAVLSLAGDLAEHLVEPADVRALGERLAQWARTGGAQGRPRRAGLPARPGAAASGRRALRGGEAGARAARLRRRRRARGPAGAALPRGARRRADRAPGGAARRVPGHRGRPGGAARLALRRRAPRHRGRRPLPEHLRLARRERRHPAPLRRALRRRGSTPRGCARPTAAAVGCCCWPTPCRSRCARRVCRSPSSPPRPGGSATARSGWRCCPTSWPRPHGWPGRSTTRSRRSGPTRTTGTGPAPPCCAASGRCSRGCGRPSRTSTCLSRWSGSAAC